MKLLPIKRTLAENQELMEHPDCRNTLQMSIDFYERAGFDPPWIGYYVQVANQMVGSGGFKGKPAGGKVEIAYSTFPQFQRQGIGTQICRQLVLLALQTDPAICITARTLPENNASARILRKNRFELLGTLWDKEDGQVWEWTYKKHFSDNT